MAETTHAILSSDYQSTPSETTGMPKGIPFIIANEAAERFSFYGMKAALAIFLANYLGALGGANLSESQATSYVSYFNGAVYLTPLFGALIADTFFGKYRTIITLSIVYCLGHLSLAFMGAAAPFNSGFSPVSDSSPSARAASNPASQHTLEISSAPRISTCSRASLISSTSRSMQAQ